MKAYHLAMIWICICAGFFLVGSMNVFGNQLNEHDNVFSDEKDISKMENQNPVFNIGPFEIDEESADDFAIGIATLFAFATVVVLNSNAVNDRGLAYILFTVGFWIPFIAAFSIIDTFDYEGLGTIKIIFSIISLLIFFITLIQMPTGGQKNFE